MARNNLYGEERPLPYWVRLIKMLDRNHPRFADAPPFLMYLDLRGGEFTRATSSRLADVFDWVTKAHSLGYNDLTDYCLEIIPLPRDEDEMITGGRSPYVRDDWPDLQKQSFLWIPVVHSDTDRKYAWQR